MGLSVAKLLASKGANVAIIARNKEKLDRAVGEIRVPCSLSFGSALVKWIVDEVLGIGG